MIDEQFQQLLAQTIQVAVNVLLRRERYARLGLERCLTNLWLFLFFFLPIVLLVILLVVFLIFLLMFVGIIQNLAYLFLVERISADVVLEYQDVVRCSLHRDDILTISQYGQGHVLFCCYLLQVVELLVVGDADFLAHRLTYFIKNGFQFTHQFDVGAQSLYGPRVILYLHELVDMLLIVAWHEGEVILVVLGKLA